MWTVENALSPERCAAYVARFHAATPERAPVVTANGTEIDTAVRNNTRVMWDDQAEANELVATVRARVPATWNAEPLVGGNPRLRVYRYEPGEHHSAHWDTVVELPPARGTALLFQHRVLHAALGVTSGVKYALRTDVLYRARPR